MQDKIQAALIFATRLREPRSLSKNTVELANEGHGEHRASREAGDGAQYGREGAELNPGPNKWRGGRQRGGRRTRLKEKLCCSIYLVFDPCKVFQSGRTLLQERGQGVFSFPKFRFHLHCFCGAAAVPCCVFSLVRTILKIRQ